MAWAGPRPGLGAWREREDSDLSSSAQFCFLGTPHTCHRDSPPTMTGHALTTATVTRDSPPTVTGHALTLSQSKPFFP